MSNSLASLTSVEWTQSKLDEKQTLADIYTVLTPDASGNFTGTLEPGKKYWYDWTGTPAALDLRGLVLNNLGTVELHIHYNGTADIPSNVPITFPNGTDGSQNWLWIESSNYGTADVPTPIKGRTDSGSAQTDGHFIGLVIRKDKSNNLIVNKAYDYFLQPSAEA